MLQPLVTHTPSEKKDARKKLLKSLRASRDVKFAILLDIADEATRAFLKNGSEALGVLFLDTADEAIMPWIDAVVTDRIFDEQSWKIFRDSAVVPIIFEDHNPDKVFDHFNPMKFTGNAFLAGSNDPYAVFMQICRFIENIRYPGDYRTLLKNVATTNF